MGNATKEKMEEDKAMPKTSPVRILSQEEEFHMERAIVPVITYAHD